MLEFKLSRLLAVAERDLRRFRRNSTLMIPMALMPIIYLVILGKAMGGDLHDLRIALVDEDHGRAAVVVHDRLRTLEQSRNLFKVTDEPSPTVAAERLRRGGYKAGGSGPEQLRRRRDLLTTRDEPSPAVAVGRLRQGAYKAFVIVPEQFSTAAARGERAPLGV